MVNTTKQGDNCGHVFLLHCDAENLAADAILLPGNPGPPSGVRALETSPDSRVKLYEAADTHGAADTDQLLATGLQIVNDFLAAATEAVGSVDSKFRRAKPLLALPLIGVGRMDPDDLVRDEGTAVSTILPVLYEHVNKSGVDVALCTTDVSAYRVMQVQREKLCPFQNGAFWMLSKKMKQHAELLATDALRGSLSLFVGAGVSYPSGLPSWGGLLGGLAAEAGFSEEDQKKLKELDYLDQPTLIEEKMGRQFRLAIAKAVQGGRYTPTHAVLAELRVPSATTNYDDLFEAAAASTSDEKDTVMRLPWASAEVSETGSRSARTLTKLHGCVSHPDEIVLTRQDYMRYEDDRRALRGLVQQMLLTSNIVFIGFSMSDNNLHKIIDEVREALNRKNRKNRTDKLGTITTLTENEMFRQLWDQDFNVVAFGQSWADNPAWIHDCFFDYVGTLVASRKAHCSFILNPKYGSLLSEEEKKIAEALGPLVEIADDPKIQETDAWVDVRKLLSLLGAPQ